MKNKAPTRRSCRITKSNEESPYITGKRKRKNSVPVVLKPKLQKIDEYCWICHQLGHEYACSSCSRVYHTKCIKKKHIQFNSSGSCGECQAQCLNGGITFPGQQKYPLPDLLDLVLREALKDNGKKNNQKSQPLSDDNIYIKYFNTCAENSSLCQAVDLSMLIDKTKKKFFLTTADFFSHAKWIYHNSYIEHGEHSIITETALKMEKNLKKEILHLEACAECYYNKHQEEDHRANFFTKICEEPHDIIWAKLRGSPYWPAKCMRIYNGHADVTFFGTHDRSSIQLSQCYRISSKAPNNKVIKNSKYQEALNELSVYYSNYCEVYNSFPLHEFCTPLVDSSAISPKKTNKRGRHRRSPSRKQLDDSFSSGVRTKLDTSLLHSPADSSLSLNNCEMKGSELPSKEISKSEQVAVCMTFTEDEEASPYNQMSMPSKLLNVSPVESSVPRGCSTPITSCSPMIVETPDLLHITETNLKNVSQHFTNSGSSNVPVIASVSTDAGLNSTFGNELLETSEEIHNPVINHANIPNSQNAYPSNMWSEQSQEVNNSVIMEDDDVQLIREDPPKESMAVNAVLNNAAMLHALSQVISSNKPHLQELYDQCLNFGVTSFVRIWLSTVVKIHGEDEVLKFAKAYDRLHKEKEALKEEKLRLLKEYNYMKENYSTIQKDCDCINVEYNIIENKYKDLVIIHKQLEEKFAEINDQRNNAAKVANNIMYNNPALETVQKLREENKKLQDDLIQVQNNFSKKVAELEESKKNVLSLEDDLKSALEKSSLTTSSECQTVLSDLPEYQMFTLKEFEKFKKACHEQSCSKHTNLTKDDYSENVEITRQTVTKDDYSGGMAITRETIKKDDYSGGMAITRETIKKVRNFGIGESEDEVGPPVNIVSFPALNPHIFATGGSLCMEYAMGPPNTVVSSIIPTNVVLSTDFVPQNQQSTYNSVTKRQKNKKRSSHPSRY